MDQELLERMVKEVMASLAGNNSVNNEVSPKNTNRVNRQDYPLSIKRADLVKSATGKKLEDITLEGTRDSYTVSGKDIEYGHFEHCMIPFYTAQKITDMQFSTNVNETAID